MMHLLKYLLIQTVREKENMFWALMFPIVLGTFFYFSFGSGDMGEDMEAIPVAVVREAEDHAFMTFLDEMDGGILKVSEMTEDKAQAALKGGKVAGIFHAGDTLSLTVGSSGISESILKSLLDTYQKNAAMMERIAEEYPERMQDALQSLGEYRTMTTAVSPGGKTHDNNVMYFFALIGMACLFGAFLGLQSIYDMKPNLSALGARQSITPTHRLKLILCDLIVVFVIHYINILLVVAYLRFVLKINLGDNIAALLSVCLLGSMIGVAYGIMIGCLKKVDKGVKIGIVVGSSLFFSFLAGMMVGNMKDIIERSCPVVNRLNPAAVLSDAFYCMAVYDSPERFLRNIITMVIMAVLFVTIAFLGIRRERYDSI